MKVEVDKDGVCKECLSSGETTEDLIKKGVLPIWRDESGLIHYDLPHVFADLYEAEKLLIQMISPYVPLVHIKNGTLGLKGHVCSFPQALKDVVVELPRLPEDVNMIRLIRNYADKEGVARSKSFVVHRGKVLEVLRWLIKHNVVYREHVRLVESNLDWLGDAEEGELPGIKDGCKIDVVDEPVDEGPAKQQCTPEEERKCLKCSIFEIISCLISNAIFDPMWQPI
jgi:hypothetical protein